MSDDASTAGDNGQVRERESRPDRLQRALDYPYRWPGACYLFHGGAAHAVIDRERHRTGRTPVLAYGSNRAPEQLLRKFGKLAAEDAILVECCEISGWDVVHSAHVTSYGAIPAALHVHPDVTVRVAVTWLDRNQLGTMDSSERAGRNYGRRRLDCTVLLGDGAASDDIEAYLTSHGPLVVENEIVGHADIEARGRRHAALRNEDVLRRLHRVFDPTARFEESILRLSIDADYRERATRRLKEGL